MNRVAGLVTLASQKVRQKRAEIFRNTFSLGLKTKLLDLGSEDGSNIAFVLEGSNVKPENVFIADIETSKLEIGQKNMVLPRFCSTNLEKSHIPISFSM